MATELKTDIISPSTANQIDIKVAEEQMIGIDAQWQRTGSYSMESKFVNDWQSIYNGILIRRKIWQVKY